MSERSEAQNDKDQAAAPSSELTVKHPLQNAWVLWFDNPVKRLGAKDWSSNLKKVATFDVVEDFWGIFNNIRPPSRLNPGSNYHLFKLGIEPTWEHATNMNGGKWTYSIPKKDGKKLIDDMWLYTVLAMIGENFDAGDELCGAVISLRKAGDRVAVWTKSADDEKSCREIGQQFKAAISECLGTEVPEDSIEYHVHNDALQSIKNKSDGNKKEAKYKI
mmetsp:Transcript_23087/g.75138  ORF Transcript_23087/g.75138 Transcript_23087/m.75138 type:complete len:218 (-) Transcript_23087:237-890(-)